ncbi:MAG: hypothetical protein ACTSSP_09810 [Candidatus Asgardarchaeia archaeon]
MIITVDGFEIENRFELLIFETAEEYIRRKTARKKDEEKRYQQARREATIKGICQLCEEKKPSMWVSGDFTCYDCHIFSLEMWRELSPLSYGGELDCPSEEAWNEICEEKKNKFPDSAKISSIYRKGWVSEIPE